MALARRVPVRVLCEALAGGPVDAALVEDAVAVAAAYPPGSASGPAEDVALAHLVAVLGDGEEGASRIALLAQACDATAALIGNVLLGEDGVPVRLTRRVGPAGEPVVLDLEAPRLPYGAGPRACPGEAHAVAIAAAVVEAVLAAAEVVEDAPACERSPNLRVPRASVSVGADAERGEPGASLGGDGEAAVGGAAHEPVPVEKRRREGGAERAGEVGSPLAPVEARTGEAPLLRARRVHVDAEAVEQLLARGGQRERGVAADEGAVGDECVGESDAEPPGEVVVAGACGLQRGLASGSAQRADGSRRGETGQQLERLGDGGRGEPVAALASGDLAGEDRRREAGRGARSPCSPRCRRGARARPRGARRRPGARAGSPPASARP